MATVADAATRQRGTLPASSTPNVYPYWTGAGVRWLFRFRDSRGKPSTRRGFPSEAAAAKARERLLGRKHSQGVVAGRMTFAEFVERWLRVRRPYLEPGSWADYEIHVRKRLVPEFGQRRLTAITTLEIQEWLVEASEAGEYAPKTLNNAFGVLSAALGFAAREGRIPANPALGVERLPLGHVEPDWLRLHEIPLYLDGCSPVYRPLAQLLIASGLRISEALALVWDDVDFERRIIRVYRSAKRGGTGSTKGKRFRPVRVGPDLMRVLHNHLAGQTDRLAGEMSDRHVFVMPIRERKRDRGRWASKTAYEPMRRTTVSMSWHKAALEDAGLRDMPLHALRHTAAASWLLSGNPLVFVQRQLGHASITTTERIYGHLEESYLQGAAETTEAAIRSAGPEPSRPSVRPAVRLDHAHSASTHAGRLRYSKA